VNRLSRSLCALLAEWNLRELVERGSESDREFAQWELNRRERERNPHLLLATLGLENR